MPLTRYAKGYYITPIIELPRLAGYFAAIRFLRRAVTPVRAASRAFLVTMITFVALIFAGLDFIFAFSCHLLFITRRHTSRRRHIDYDIMGLIDGQLAFRCSLHDEGRAGRQLFRFMKPGSIHACHRSSFYHLLY